MAVAMHAENEYSLGGRFLAPLWRFLNQFSVDVTPNPTKKWVRSSGLELIIDLDKSTLNEVMFGEPISALSFLGKCDRCMPMICKCVDEAGKQLGLPGKSYDLSYYADGLGIGTDRRWNIDSFDVHFNPYPRDPRFPHEPIFNSYTGRIIWNGQPLDLTALRNVDSLVKTFGSPNDDRETPAHDTEFEGETFTQPYSRFLSYDKPHAWWFISVSEAGLVYSISVNRALSVRQVGSACLVDDKNG